MIHHTKLFVRRLAYTPWLLAAGLVLGWAGAAAAQDRNGLSVADASATESDGATVVNVVFTVTRTGPNSEAVTVDYMVSSKPGNTASIGADYIALPGTATIDATQTTTQITVSVINDELDEDAETFTLELSNPSSGVALIDAIAIGTINDDDPEPEITIGAASAAEGTPVEFTVNLEEGGTSRASSKDVTVNYEVSIETGNSAESADLTGTLSGTLTIAAGQTSGTVSVATVDDMISEASDETFTVTLSDPSNATFTGGSTTLTATGTITGDTDPLPTLSVEDAEGDENTVLRFTVTLSAESEDVVTVQYTVSTENDDTATLGVDYGTATALTLTILAGQTSGTIFVPIIADAMPEGEETFTLTLTNPSASAQLSATAASVKGRIRSQLSMLSVSDMSATEGMPVVFTVSLSERTTEDVTVEVSTSDGTATAGTDYVAVSAQMVTIDKGEVSETVSIETLEDGLIEGPETFTLTLSNPTNATIDTEAASATGTINDDDVPPSLSVSDASAEEGDPVVFKVTVMTDEVIAAVTVMYTISVGEGDTAVESNDFSSDVMMSGTLTFAAGAMGDDLMQTVSVMTRDDGDDEQNENFRLTLSAAMNATIEDGIAVGRSSTTTARRR
ncbi:MAG: hypothetical protein OXH81_14485 [Gemmatimonadetes bacterium]|nr:hypothetical protein [Gemmatimonadota bacterium]